RQSRGHALSPRRRRQRRGHGRLIRRLRAAEAACSVPFPRPVPAIRMAAERIMDKPLGIFGLPSRRLRALADRLGIPQLDDVEIRRAHDLPDEPRSFEAERLAEQWERHPHWSRDGRALLVFHSPWRFLERQLRASACVPVTPAQIEWFARNAFGFWHA